MKKIIITGAPRTGTTALGSLLSHSTNAFVANELGLFEEFPRRYYIRKSELLRDSTNVRYLELKGLTEKDMDSFFIGNFENKGNIEFVGDKFPGYCLDADYCNHMHRNHSDAYFIFTYRNPCATIYSGIKRSRIEKDEGAEWFFTSLETSVHKLVARTSNWVNLILPYVKNKIIIDYDHYINDVNLLINDLNLFLNTKLDIDEPEPLYYHSNPNEYRSEMSEEMIAFIDNETRSLDQKIKHLINNSR